MSDTDVENDQVQDGDQATNISEQHHEQGQEQEQEQVLGSEVKEEKKKATRKTAKTRTPEEILQLIKDKKKEIELLEQQVHGANLNELIKKHGLVDKFKLVQAEAAAGVTDLHILKTLGTLVEIKRLVVTQSAVIPRAKRKKD